MNESSKVPAKYESIIIIPSGVMNFQSRKLKKKILHLRTYTLLIFGISCNALENFLKNSGIFLKKCQKFVLVRLGINKIPKGLHERALL
jgi:hypothetical protein